MAKVATRSVYPLFLLLAVLVVLTVQSVEARDFMESPVSVVFEERIASNHPFAVHPVPVVYAETAFNYQLFRDSPEDKFQIRHLSHFGIADFGPVRTTVYYGSFLFCGPVNEGDVPGAEAAQWMMNAIQFEYGLTAQVPVREWILIGEYGRRSYHPFRSGFGQPAADILRGGIAPPVIAWRGVTLESLVRGSWFDLYDFWESDLPLPRVRYSVSQSYELRYAFPAGPRPTARSAVLEPFVLALADTGFRRGGSVTTDLALQAGLRVGPERPAVGSARPVSRLELYLDYYRSPDTEQRRDAESPATLLGYGFRFRYSGAGQGR